MTLALPEPVQRTEALRYGGAALVVVALFAAALLRFSASDTAEPASDPSPDAVLIDLEPALTSSAPKSDAADGPAQAASQASAASEVSEEPAAQQTRPDTQPRKPAAEQPVPPPPTAAAPPAVLDPKTEPVTPKATVPPQAETAAAPEQVEQAPSGSDVPAVTAETSSEADRPHASRRAMTLWQKALMSRIVAAKAHLHRPEHRTGTVLIAFTIDGRGALVKEGVARSSGDAGLDRSGLALVRQAAPFPVPPQGAERKDLEFDLPIEFRR